VEKVEVHGQLTLSPNVRRLLIKYKRSKIAFTVNIFHHCFEALGLWCRKSETIPAGVYKFLAQRLKCFIFLGQSAKEDLEELWWSRSCQRADTRTDCASCVYECRLHTDTQTHTHIETLPATQNTCNSRTRTHTHISILYRCCTWSQWNPLIWQFLKKFDYIKMKSGREWKAVNNDWQNASVASDNWRVFVFVRLIDPRVGKIRNEASSCTGIFSRTLRFCYVAVISFKIERHMTRWQNN